MADKQNVSKELVTVTQWEEALQSSAREHGNIVAEIFSTKWGACRAIAPTFRRIFFEVDEAAKLKFYTVDAMPILAELEEMDKAPPIDHGGKKKKDAELFKETLPEAWRPYLAQQNEMTTVKTPADEFITNAQLLEVWGEYFDQRQSEVDYPKFMGAMNAICKLTVPLNDAENTALREALGVDKDMVAFTALLPQYEERAISVRIEQEEKAKADGAGGAEGAAAEEEAPAEEVADETAPEA